MDNENMVKYMQRQYYSVVKSLKEEYPTLKSSVNKLECALLFNDISKPNLDAAINILEAFNSLEESVKHFVGLIKEGHTVNKMLKESSGADVVCDSEAFKDELPLNILDEMNGVKLSVSAEIEDGRVVIKIDPKDKNGGAGFYAYPSVLSHLYKEILKECEINISMLREHKSN